MPKVINREIVRFKRFAINLVTYPEGLRVMRHNDPVSEGKYYKFNVVLKQPKVGGQFCADKVIFNLFNRVYFFRPDLYSHSVTPIQKGQRKLLSVAILLQ